MTGKVIRTELSNAPSKVEKFEEQTSDTQDFNAKVIRGLFKKYPDRNCSGCSMGGMCLHPVLTCSYMS